MKRSRLNNRKLKDDILHLRSQGKSYREISKLLDCSKSVISYHCGSGSEKERACNYYKTKDTPQKAIRNKLNNFRSRHVPKLVISKTKSFKRATSRNKTIVNNITEGNYTSKDVLNKIGANPKCYLTGEPIDLYSTNTYEFDHIIPIKQGGTNDLSNLQICLKEANKAKGELMLEDFYELCAKVLTHKDKKNTFNK